MSCLKRRLIKLWFYDDTMDTCLDRNKCVSDCCLAPSEVLRG